MCAPIWNATLQYDNYDIVIFNDEVMIMLPNKPGGIPPVGVPPWDIPGKPFYLIPNHTQEPRKQKFNIRNLFAGIFNR